MKDVTFWVDIMNVFHVFQEVVWTRVPRVPTELNPADFGSRGINASYLKNNKQRWFGPEF